MSIGVELLEFDSKYYCKPVVHFAVFVYVTCLVRVTEKRVHYK